MMRPTPKSSSDLDLVLSAARNAVGDPAAIQRVREGVLAKIASGAAPPASVSVAGAWLGKSLGALLLTAGAGALLYRYSVEAPPTAADRPQLSAPQPQNVPSPSAALDQPVPREVDSDTRIVKPQQELLSAPPAGKRTPAAAPRAKAARVRGSAAQSGAAVAPGSCADAQAEVNLLSRAQQAMRSEPQVALTLLAEHAQRYSCGVLALERDTLRIDAERALGLHAQAEQHARELVDRYPSSPEAPALKQKLGDDANGGSEHKIEPVATPTL